MQWFFGFSAMAEEQHQLEPLSAEAEQLELCHRPAGRQYCIFRSGRERFCFSVLMWKK